ncbi:MAG: ATP-binding cassette domain-containing protein [Verrucomicrobia bacterium]|nr:ATP-binding cassette domain-containing protein [Verrucomicrobiota bacterium]
MIELAGLSKRFGAVTAVDEVTLTVDAGETMVLLGTSGCGKTTTLRMINRLVVPSAGTVRVAGRDAAATDPVALRRKIGYMIQGVGLFPHRTVEENILTVPRLIGWGTAESRRRLHQLTEIVNLEPALLPRLPHELSGGQRQRAGLARALAADPPIVLMDEPFGALDPLTRQQVRREFLRVESLVNKTIVLVTHDTAEAVELGSRICLMAKGRIEQVGAPAELLFRPRTPFVEDFFAAGRLQLEWMAVRMAELPGAGRLHGEGLGSLTVAEALARLERTDEAAFNAVLKEFFAHRRKRAGGPAEAAP